MSPQSLTELANLVSSVLPGQSIWVRLEYSGGTYIFEKRAKGWYQAWHADGKKRERFYKVTSDDVAWTMEAASRWTLEG